MQTRIVYIDDASYARQQLAPLCTARGHEAGAGGPQAAPTHWVLVACAPRMTHRISKWVSHSARENWRAKWAGKVFGDISPWLRQRGDRVTEVLATGPLGDLVPRLQAEHPDAQLLDGRRPKQDPGQPPVGAEPPNPGPAPWTWPGTIASICMSLMLVTE